MVAKGKGSSKPKRTKHYRPAGKKKEGNAARFVTRSQAVKHLQVTLPQFRKLCILKGVFPREPKKKVRGNNKTYYHVKDAAFLQHDPLLEKFRQIRAYGKKINKAKSKRNDDLASRLLSRQPSYTLDRLIRERYPKFSDALRDLDDCLSLVHLFSVLPAVDSLKIDVDRVHNCQKLAQQWQDYVSRTSKLRKVFISVKGIYYQAEIEGHKITWITPHSMQQILPEDVNFNIMLTFLEFYETFLGFVNFKLLQSSNEELDDESNSCRNLFKNKIFYLNREVPKESLAFVITSFGGTCAWEGEDSPFEESDETITHQIVDRPLYDCKYPTRDYIQPQWVYDCVNSRILLPAQSYALGKVPPPHLSPFVDDEAEGYVPDYAKAIKELKEGARKEIAPIDAEGDSQTDSRNKVSTIEELYHRELKMEMEGAAAVGGEEREGERRESGENNGEELQRVTLTRKQRGLYEAIKIGEKRKRAKVDKLKERKRKINAKESG